MPELPPFKNPFRPGAGQKPPHLAGRDKEKDDFLELLRQDIVMKNLIITGLRGTGKTVLLESLKPLAIDNQWLWIGSDLSESASVSEESMAIRILTDLSLVTSIMIRGTEKSPGFGDTTSEITLDYNALLSYFSSQPGLVSDKLKATLEHVWKYLKADATIKGIVFAYDEAQNMSDQMKEKQYPLSLLLDVFQSLQRKEIPFLLALVGLPTLFPKLVESRTYSERMFHILELTNLSPKESRDAIVKPIVAEGCPISFDESSIELIIRESGGYPYFIQSICRDTYDSFLYQITRGVEKPSVPIVEIINKLDTEFFSGRWSRVTDRQRDLLGIVAQLPNCEGEFTIQDVIDKTLQLSVAPFSSSHINQMFSSLMEVGLIHRTRHGKYTLGIPLLGKYIIRQIKHDATK